MSDNVDVIGKGYNYAGHDAKYVLTEGTDPKRGQSG